jgi:hypothetical protein
MLVLSFWMKDSVSADQNPWIVVLPDEGFDEYWKQGVEGFGWPLGSEVTLKMDDPSNGVGVDYQENQRVGSADQNVPGDTYVYFDIQDNFDINPGCMVTLSDGVITKTHTVTNIEVTDKNPKMDTVSGTADPGTDITVQPEEGGSVGVTSDADGNWFTDFSGIFDLVQGTIGTAWQEDMDGDQTRIRWRVNDPWLLADPVSDSVRGAGWYPGTELTLTIDDPDTGSSPDYTDTKRVTENVDSMYFSFFDNYDLESGHIVTLSDGIFTDSHTVRNLTVNEINILNETVLGTADPGTEVGVDVHRGDQLDGQLNVVTDENGYWIADFKGITDLTMGPEGIGVDIVATINDKNGNSTWIWAEPPILQIEVFRDEDRIEGSGWPEGNTLTLNIDDPTNGASVDYSDEKIVQPTTPWGEQETYVEFKVPLDVQAGFEVILTDGSLTKSHIVSNFTLTLVDNEADTIAGTADPHTQIDVRIHEPVCCNHRHVTADDEGNWMADYSEPGDKPDEIETVDIVPGANGLVIQNDIDGDTTNVTWRSPERPYLCEPGNTVVGTVYAADGETILEGARVQFDDLETHDPLFYTETDENGYYSCDLPEGEYISWASAPGYAREYFQETIFEHADFLDIETASQIYDINFSLDTSIAVVEHLVFNLDTPILEEMAVRQAIAYGTDRLRMISETWPASPLRHTYLSHLDWAYTTEGVTKYFYDPELARDLLNGAGWVDSDEDGIREKNGERLQITYVTTESPERLNMADIFTKNMEEIGIEVTLVTEDPWGTIFHRHEFDVAEFAWAYDMNDPIGYHGEVYIQHNYYNAGSYQNPESDQLLADVDRLAPRAEKLPYYHEHQILVMAGLAELPLAQRCVNPDSDCDGVTDTVDRCPEENAWHNDVDGDGCPDTCRGMVQLIEGMPEDEVARQMKKSLTSKVESACRTMEKGKEKPAANKYWAFIHHVEAQRGKKISTEAADLLIRYAENLIAHIEDE